jgi:hypothetical protein
MALVHSKTDFVDNRVTGPSWAAFKVSAKCPGGQVPVLEVRSLSLSLFLSLSLRTLVTRDVSYSRSQEISLALALALARNSSRMNHPCITIIIIHSFIIHQISLR